MKKLVLFLIISAIAFTACTNNDTKTAEKKADNNLTMGTNAQRNLQTTMDMFDAFNKHDINNCFKDWTPGAIDYSDGSMPSMKTDSVKAFWNAWIKAFPDYKANDMKFAATADGVVVMVWSQWDGTWTNEIMGQKPTGKKMKVSDVDIFNFDNQGKIVEHHNIQPFSTIAQQVGLKL
jgi:predicted ester cyclase